MGVSFHAASRADEEVFLPMMAAPREHEGIPFDTDAMRATLAVLFADSGLGRVWFMLDDGVVAGYAMGT